MVKRLLMVCVLVVLVVALCLTQCVAKPATGKPVVIGAIFTTTGDNAPLGVPQRNTVEMLVKQVNAAGGINGRPVKVEFYDDGGKPEQAAKACSALLDNKNVVAIIGPTLSGPSLAIAPMCESAKMPLLSCAASVKIVQPVRPYVFKTAQTDSLIADRLVDYCLKKGYSRVGFINDTNAFGASGREQWINLSKRGRIKTVAVESFATGDSDMTSQLTKIRSAKPQAVICWGTNPGPAVVAKNMRTLGMKTPLLMSHGIANMEFINLAGGAANGVVFPAGKIVVADQIPASDPQKKILSQYTKSYAAAYKKGATTFSGHSWDSFNLVTKAVASQGTNRAKIRDFIENTKGFVGISGVFNMSRSDHNGISKNAIALIQIVKGKWKLIN